MSKNRRSIDNFTVPQSIALYLQKNNEDKCIACDYVSMLGSKLSIGYAKILARKITNKAEEYCKNFKPAKEDDEIIQKTPSGETIGSILELIA